MEAIDTDCVAIVLHAQMVELGFLHMHGFQGGHSTQPWPIRELQQLPPQRAVGHGRRIDGFTSAFVPASAAGWMFVLIRSLDRRDEQYADGEQTQDGFQHGCPSGRESIGNGG